MTENVQTAETKTENAPYVFVSYASKDREKVLQVVAALKEAGLDVWLDQGAIPGGGNYGVEIVEGIKGCLALMLMCSGNSLGSRNVRQEVQLAWKYQRPYIPLLLEHVTVPPDFEYWLEGYQWIEVLDNPTGTWLPRALHGLDRLTDGGNWRSSTAAAEGHHPAVDGTQLAGGTATAEPRPAPAPAPPPAPRQAELPLPPTELVGREAEVEQVTNLITSGRIVTLTGAGGSGKSRVALQVASNLIESFRDGVLYVPLAPVMDADLVPRTIAAAADIQESGDQPILEKLRDNLKDKQVLLVLDNFEQVIAAAPVMAQLLAACPELKLLVTSRARLHIRGEQEVPIKPLGLPNVRRLPPVEGLLAFPAIKLFVDRAQAARPNFELNADNAATVAQLCVKLDGLPLAIELAAARIKILTPQAMLSRLDDPLKLLTGGARDLPERQQTLRNTIGWSYELLPAGEQALFRRLTVFVGGCSFEAAEAVCSSIGDLDVDILDGLTALVNNSLLQQEEQDLEPRFSMLTTVREYGLEELENAGEADRLREEHARYCLEWTQQAESGMYGKEQETWLTRIEEEYDNLRAALRWCLDTGNVSMALAASMVLTDFWLAHGYLSEGRTWLNDLLAATADAEHTIDHANALRGVGMLAFAQGHLETGEEPLRQSLAICRELSDDAGTARALAGLGKYAMEHGNYRESREFLEEALELFKGVGDRWGAAQTLYLLGNLLAQHGDAKEARKHCEESLAGWKTLGSRRNRAITLSLYGRVLHISGIIDPAIAALEEAVGDFRELEDWASFSAASFLLGLIFFEQGDLERARSSAEESLAAVSVAQDSFLHRPRTLHLLGQIELELEGWEAARDALHAAEEISTAHNQRGMLPEIQRSLAQAYLGLKDLVKAEEYARKAREVVAPEDVYSQGTTLLVLAKVLAEKGSAKEAEEAFGDGLMAIEDSHEQFEIGTGHQWYAEFLASQDRLDEAKDHLNEALNAYDRMNSMHRVAHMEELLGLME